MLRGWICGLTIISLMGCDNSPSLEKHLQDYQGRMANVLDAPSIEFEKVSLPPYPLSKELKSSIPATTIQLFEYYDLKHCELYSLIAERNTSLGNLQLPSTRYVYERQLLTALENCIRVTEDPRLQIKLREWQQIKRDQLPLVWADLVQISSETKYAFSTNLGLVDGNDRDGLNSIKIALTYLLQLREKHEVSGAQIERNLHRLLKNPLPAKLWLSQRTLAEQLQQSTQWLVTHTQGLKCKSSDNKMDYLANVFQLFFIEKIQPIASQVNHYHYQLDPIFQKMTSHPDLSLHFKRYIKQFSQDGFASYQDNMLQHVQFWQRLFKRCNIQPGGL